LPPDSALVLEGGERAGYVVASFCIGNGVKEPRFEEPGPALGVIGAPRPAGAGRGGGAAGCEVAAHAASPMGRPGPALLGSSSRGLGLGARPRGSASAVRVPAGEWRRGAARLLYPLLRRGIATAEAGRSGGGGSDRPRDRCRAAPSVPALAPGEGTDGGLWTGHHLSSPSDGCTFDGGDSASFRGQGLTRLGVFAIRQGAGAVPQPSGLLRGKPWKCPARLTATLKRRID
jgi:hypothetical protein